MTKKTEIERLTQDRNLEKKLRKDSDERAHNAEAERDAALAEVERLKADNAGLTHVKDAFASQMLALQAKLASLTRFTALVHNQMREALEKHAVAPMDWACAECRPNSDMLKAGFQCSYHAALAVAKTMGESEIERRARLTAACGTVFDWPTPPQEQHLKQALNANGCERIKDFYQVGPVQRAAVESFADALAATQAPAPKVAQQKLTDEQIHDLLIAFRGSADWSDDDFDTAERFVLAIEKAIGGQ